MLSRPRRGRKGPRERVRIARQSKEGARERLAPLCVNGKEVGFAMPVHVVSARKA
jgi:hypothetical protein